MEMNRHPIVYLVLALNMIILIMLFKIMWIQRCFKQVNSYDMV